MDSLKQLVASRLKAQMPGQLHPDAETLSAFAEDALAPKERQTILEHVGVCADCRAILFLGAPLHADPQQTFAVKKSWAPFALRWGAVAACVVIAAAVVGRRELTRTSSLARLSPEMQKAAPVSAAAPPSNTRAKETSVAAEKAPAELDANRDRLSAKLDQPALADRGHAEPKAITAKPQAAMAFAKSGQVSVAQPSADLKMEAKEKDLPIQGRNANEIAALPPGNVAAPARASGGGIGGPVSSSAYSASVNGLATQVGYHGYVMGTIADATGVVIPNAKVTATGPLGEKTATSDQAGKFSIGQLPAGAYSFTVSAPGFRDAQLQQVAVLPGKPATMNFKLDVGATSETVEVSSSALAVSTDAGPARANEAIGTGAGAGAAGKVAPATAQTAQLEVSGQMVAEQELKKQKSANSRWGRRVDKDDAVLPSQWSLSPEGTVQRSSDNSKTWRPVPVGNGTTFRAIWAEGSNVWAGGNAGALFHSADAGRHWAQVIPAANGEKLQADITGIDFSDPQHGTVTSATGQVWTTADRGQSWQRKP
jgi:hypothetical protein